eukprot:CAMPEP_0174384654 /NCGR_PEP_ID=MMETSP0811_2-20130205/126046_1 /TAXON_ID=73025 ORGANISM="Eutreptiella gymnastica-like, Strain CCMP1594" /NCGR_SAMPLE_ID=MMETSP0811_2 /ASSEMBLY_ACC=CAM_ASM_000667 /LENGTH=109 /DNA_ID=CAMNT_0015538681 /DNA_START=975 /DNA_END=1304 /DNA_ORIENTATION=-
MAPLHMHAGHPQLLSPYKVLLSSWSTHMHPQAIGQETAAVHVARRPTTAPNARHVQPWGACEALLLLGQAPKSGGVCTLCSGAPSKRISNARMEHLFMPGTGAAAMALH